MLAIGAALTKKENEGQDACDIGRKVGMLRQGSIVVRMLVIPSQSVLARCMLHCFGPCYLDCPPSQATPSQASKHESLEHGPPRKKIRSQLCWTIGILTAYTLAFHIESRSNVSCQIINRKLSNPPPQKAHGMLTNHETSHTTDVIYPESRERRTREETERIPTNNFGNFVNAAITALLLLIFTTPTAQPGMFSAKPKSRTTPNAKP